MITPDYCSTMARYGWWQNESLVTAADGLSPEDRAMDRGAFFGGISDTLNHLLWADMIWMSRFDGGEAPKGAISDSKTTIPDWPMFKAKRAEVNARILTWADTLTATELEGELAWFAMSLGRELSKPKVLCIAHMFNHATHHRGQIHAMLTAAGARPDDTDLIILPKDERWL